MKKKRILIAAGGSGGHLLPAQQLSLSLKEHADVVFAGHRLSQSAFFEHDQFPFHSIEAAPLSFKRLFSFAWISCRSIVKAIRLLRSFQPDLVIGFGSYHSFPVMTAAVLLRKKISLFEANCQLGKVNRLFSPFAQSTVAQFPLQSTIDLVPLLPWKERAPARDKREAKQLYGLDPDKTTYLVFGGSQGAAFLNRAIPAALDSSMQAIHLAGKEERVEMVVRFYRERGIAASVKAYEPEMDSAYAAADFAICRSGASTMAELIAYELPALLIPFPFSADSHQITNAEFLAKKINGATMLLEAESHQEALMSKLNDLIDQREAFQEALRVYRKECEGRMSFAARILGEK